MNEGILSAIGRTPLVRLSRVTRELHFNIYAKLEMLNPGGSMKDRPAYNILRRALDSGRLRPGATVVESSSGNMGVGLAQACAYYGLKFLCVVDPKTTRQNIRLMQAYGAHIDMVTQPDPETGEFLKARLNRVQELLATAEETFWPNQYANLDNPIAHHQTMDEIVIEMGGRVDYLFCATSTCGTLRGCAEYARAFDLPTRVIAVDAVGSIIFGGQKGSRLIPGHGAAVRPGLFQEGLADRCVHVTDLDCVVGCRRVARQEAILIGGSSGGVFSALWSMREAIPAGANCVVIFADRGERYLDTIYADEWVAEHFGDVSEFWMMEQEQEPCLPMNY